MACRIGIEPIFTVLETAVLPLNYRHIMAGVAGLEPADAGVKVPCLNRLGYTPNYMELPKGIEPLTYALQVRCSAY